MATNNNGFFGGVSNWWDTNFVQPTEGAYQGVPGAVPAYKNSTGVITPSGGAVPAPGGFAPITAIPQTDNWTPQNNNFAAPQTATSVSPGTQPALFAPQTQGGIATPGTVGTDPSIFQAIGNHTDGSWVGNPNIASVGTNPQQTSFLSGVGDSLSGGWDAIGGMQGLATGLDTLSGIGQTYMGFQQLGLAEDQFNFTRNAWQQDYDMRLQDYNRQVTRQEERDAALAR
ncbi:coil containing protein [Vibrio phage 1.152.O._10N.222.46.E1]|uniref:Coil containing protein n=5 Tax=Nahantvirus 49C7 TaxID=2846601 RepID=A0A2I7RB94_9CAUD|nr:coil containing protein [Vibrio phage 1.026.O._10N.222.49.C7]AUR82507.1 coil containing protein [Vibrio phage 1.025.O._10N.222.46.B6]AUR90757.1 coil containing protein [Vibrio phage 1.150.O._10N.222.46.A6]AUR90930.1 coil containing protein [Vibrio phage 1.152.O._10N.222.46.E1]AUS02398.1 coil containing protein [Vibrio phage 2.130.O._10N.222.46.C2]AUR82615.1 coil containing protein [Vibrio phage 1.026.O._10N.222.49.C7]